MSLRFICLSHPRPALLSHVAFVRQPLPLQASDFTQLNFKQILQVGAGLCNKKAGEGGHRPPCLPWMTENSERSWLVATDKNCILLLKGKNINNNDNNKNVQRRQPVFSVPQEIILLIQFLSSIYLRLMICQRDNLYHLPFRQLPPSQLIGFFFSFFLSSSNSFTGCII